MRLDLYPLEKETNDGLLTRISEECAEVIHAASNVIVIASKCKRFGLSNHHPDTPNINNITELYEDLKEIFREIKDVDLCFTELKRRMK